MWSNTDLGHTSTGSPTLIVDSWAGVSSLTLEQRRTPKEVWNKGKYEKQAVFVKH